MVLLFQAGDELYAVDTDCVEQVTPRLPFRRLPGAARGVVGLLDFRGEVLPVIDAVQMLADRSSSSSYSSRLILCKMAGNARLALLAESVLEAIEVPEEDLAEPGVASEDIPALGQVFHHDERLVQLMRVEELLTPEVRNSLGMEADAR